MVTLAVVLGRHSSASQAALSVFVPCETRLILLCNHHGEIQTFVVFYFVTKPQLFEIQSQRIDLMVLFLFNISLLHNVVCCLVR